MDEVEFQTAVKVAQKEQAHWSQVVSDLAGRIDDLESQRQHAFSMCKEAQQKELDLLRSRAKK